LPRYITATAAAISGAGCGHGRGWTDITGSILRPGRGGRRPQPDHADNKIQNGRATLRAPSFLTKLASRVDQGTKTYPDCKPDYTITDLRDLLSILDLP
jgi:hypothetical protein